MATRDENWKESELNRDAVATNPDAHPDLITGAPGSHPIGSGVGAAGGTAAGVLAGAAIGSAVAPGVGTVVGGVVGGIVGGVGGGLAGKGIAEAVNPSHLEEDTYWRENFKTRPYAQPGRDYAEFEPAYRYGRDARQRYAGRQFDEVEPDLRRDWESSNAAGGLTWEQARDASRDAWDRADSFAASPPATAANTGAFGTTAGSPAATGASTSFGSPASQASSSSFGSTAVTPPPLPPLSMATTPASDKPSFSDSRGFDDRDFDASYWKQNFTSRPYYTPSSSYDDYEPAYRYGSECRTRYAGQRFDDVEPELRSGWEKTKFNTRLGWEKAKAAVRDAFDWTERKFVGHDSTASTQSYSDRP